MFFRIVKITIRFFRSVNFFAMRSNCNPAIRYNLFFHSSKKGFSLLSGLVWTDVFQSSFSKGFTLSMGCTHGYVYSTLSGLVVIMNSVQFIQLKNLRSFCFCISEPQSGSICITTGATSGLSIYA